MKRLSILFCCVLLVECQELPEHALSGNETQITPIDNVGNYTLIQQDLLKVDQNAMLEKLRESGVQLTQEELQLLTNYLYAIAPTLERLLSEIPESLKNSKPEDWHEVIKRDSEAAAFVQKVEDSINNLSLPEKPPTLEPLCEGYWNVFLCFYIQTQRCIDGTITGCIFGIFLDLLVCIVQCPE